MIGRLRGEVIERRGDHVVVDVGGVGYTVKITANTQASVGSRVDFYIHTHVRDDAITLFGFMDPHERELFDLLIGVPNIGQVKAMGILKTPVDTFVGLVASKEVGRLAKLPGVGKKTAERILVDLADKLPASPAVKVSSGLGASVSSGARRPLGDLVSALVNLGFREAMAEEAAKAAERSLGPEADLESMLRHALKTSSRPNN